MSATFASPGTFTPPVGKVAPEIVNGRYRIPDPTTGKSRLWTRATTFAKSIEDEYHLTRWKQRMVATGLVVRQDLYAALASSLPADPTEPTKAEKDRLNELCGQAMDAAGSTRGANLGTALHDFTDAVDSGRQITIPPPWDADIAAYQAAMTAASVTILPDHIEQVITIPGLSVAGKFDRLVEHGGLIVADLKGLALATPIPTPTGWTTMADVAVGDKVFDSRGLACSVIEKSDVRWRDCYRIRFDDATSIICDGEHRWVTQTGSRGQHSAVRTTEEIRRTLRDEGTGQRDHRIANAGALALPEQVLPIDPYVLGVWIGDGRATTGQVSKGDHELFERLVACGERVGSDISSGDRCETRTIFGLRGRLRALDLLDNKHIPARYLRASANQRLALLQGLFDTDGTWNRPRRQASFCTVEKALAYQVYELIVSLGQRALLSEVERKGFGLTVTCYDVSFTPTGGLMPFRLNRKADLVDPAPGRAWRRLITDVEPIPSVATQCISVDSPDHTYLCGEQMVPTHNTAKSLDLGWGGIAIQLALYAHGETIFDPATGEHRAMPAVDQDRAIVMHLPVEQATCTLYEVDIAAGWEAAQLCLAVRDWRRRRNLATQINLIVAAPPAPVAPHPFDPDPVPISQPLTQVVTSLQADPFAGLPDTNGKPQIDRAAKRAWLLERREVLIAKPGGRGQLAARWPVIDGTPVPLLLQTDQHTVAELELIEQAITAAETEVWALFPEREDPTDPANIVVANDDPRVLGLMERGRALPPDLEQSVFAAARHEKIPRLSTGRVTEAHLATLEQLIASAETEWAPRQERIANAFGTAEAYGLSATAVCAALGVTDPSAVHGDLLGVLDTIADCACLPYRLLVDRDGVLVVDQPAAVLHAYGDDRRRVLSAGRGAAKRIGLDAPRDSDAVLAHPLLAATLTVI